MTICDDLRQSVLQAAIQGKLTKRLPEDGTAADLLASIKVEKEQLIKEKKIKKETPLAPISEDEIPFDIPDNWEWVRLGDGFHVIMGQAPDGNSVYPKCDNGKEFHQGKIFFTNEIIGESDVYCDCPKKIAPRDSALLCVRAPIGTVNITNREIGIGRGLAAVVPLASVSVRFLLYLLRSQTDSFISQGTGSTFKAITANVVLNQVVPIPPLAEQHRIVARVDELMAKIDELETVEKELVALKKAFPGDMKASLLQAAMQGKLTQQLPEDGSAADLLASIKAEKDKLIAEKKIKKDSIEALKDVPFDIPTSWCWVRLNDIVVKTVKRGKSPTYTTKSNTLVFAQKCNTKAGYINMELALFLDEGKLNKYPDDEFVQDMDIVINSTGNGTLGRVGFFRNTDNPRGLRIVPDSHVTVIRPSSQMNAAYAMYCMKYYQPYFEKTCTGSTNQTELSVDTLKNLAFPLPPLAEQERIVEKLDKLLPLCDALKEDGVA